MDKSFMTADVSNLKC